MENTELKETVEWLVKTAETSTKRYIEAEEFLMEIYALPWYMRFDIKYKIQNFFLERLKKYKVEE